MPEEFENQEVQETEEQEQVESTEVEAKEEPRVPLHEVQELRKRLERAEESDLMTRSQLAQLMTEYQKMASGQVNKVQEMQAKLDPEVRALMEPYMDVFLSPVKNELESTKAKLAEVERSKQQIEAERYIERNVPNLHEIRPALIKHLQSYSPEEQAEIAANPREVVRIAKMLTQLEGGKQGTKSMSRSMARTETGTTSTRSESDRPSNLKGDAWTKYLQDNGFFS